MKVLIDIPEEHYASLKEYVVSRGGTPLFPHTSSKDKQEVLAELLESLQEVREFERGNNTLKSAEEFLNEL